jgi:hypothetical protein
MPQHIRDITDPEHPYTLEQLNVVAEELVDVEDAAGSVRYIEALTSFEHSLVANNVCRADVEGMASTTVRCVPRSVVCVESGACKRRIWLESHHHDVEYHMLILL